MLGSLKKLELSGACPICLEDMNKPKEVVITKCSHVFHEQCMTFQLGIDERTRKSCPYCRQMPVPMVRAEELPDGLESNPHIECKILRALRESDLDYIYAALLAEPHLVEQVFEHKNNNVKYPLLTLAVIFEHQELVAFLLDKITKDSINKFSSDGFNALSAASMFGYTQIARLLLNAGAKVNNVNHSGKNALWFAACTGKKDTIELLVEFGSSVTNKTKGDFTALFIAAQNGHLDTVNYLISVIPKEELRSHVNICSSSSSRTTATALFMAAQEGYADIVSSLLLAGADPNQPINFGQIPLHVAAINGHLEVVKTLIAKGSLVNHQNRDGDTALSCAATEGHREVCEYLLSANADPTLGYMDNFFRRGVSAAEVARENGHFELGDFIENYS